jgi:hypothetical protein
LDNTISNAEISKAISSLKNKKSCGFDLISNEMIKKNSHTFLLKSLNKAFNHIHLYLVQVIFPNSGQKDIYSKIPLYCPSIHRQTRVSPRISAVPFSVCSNNPVKSATVIEDQTVNLLLFKPRL